MKKLFFYIIIVFATFSCEKENNLTPDEIIPPKAIKEITASHTNLDTTVVGVRREIYEISNVITQSTFDATKVYEWKIVESATPNDNNWRFAICDLKTCYPPFVKSGEFTFSAATGDFKIDWMNFDSKNKDEQGNYTEPITTGVCSMKVIIYPKGGGGDTITYVSKMTVVLPK